MADDSDMPEVRANLQRWGLKSSGPHDLMREIAANPLEQPLDRYLVKVQRRLYNGEIVIGRDHERYVVPRNWVDHVTKEHCCLARSVFS